MSKKFLRKKKANCSKRSQSSGIEMRVFEAEASEKILGGELYHLFIISPTGRKSEGTFQQLAHLTL